MAYFPGLLSDPPFLIGLPACPSTLAGSPIGHCPIFKRIGRLLPPQIWGLTRLTDWLTIPIALKTSAAGNVLTLDGTSNPPVLNLKKTIDHWYPLIGQPNIFLTFQHPTLLLLTRFEEPSTPCRSRYPYFNIFLLKLATSTSFRAAIINYRSHNPFFETN